jgi:type II secretory pathway pseudopilin PulG
MKKRAITLLEIMIVIFLIALIGGVVGYNMKGSMDKGKAFKTKEAMSRVKEILYLVASENNQDVKEVIADPGKFLEKSGIVKNVDALLVDGWGKKFIIEEKKGEIIVYSDALEAYEKKTK